MMLLFVIYMKHEENATVNLSEPPEILSNIETETNWEAL